MGKIFPMFGTLERFRKEMQVVIYQKSFVFASSYPLQRHSAWRTIHIHDLV